MVTENQKTPDIDQVVNDNQKLKQQLLVAKKVIEEYKRATGEQKSLNDKLGQRVATIEMERRKDKIANILSGAYTDEEFNARVESFAKSAIPFEEISNIVEPLKAMKKAAAEQTKEQEINEKAEKLAKNASLNKSSSSKVAIKNATVPSEEITEIPAWAQVAGGIA